MAIRTAEQIITELMKMNKTRVEDIEILKSWAEEIIDECAGNFECSMEDEDYCDENGKMVKVTEPYPVLMRESINRVKQQIV